MLNATGVNGRIRSLAAVGSERSLAPTLPSLQGPFHEHSNEDWFSVIDVNLHGVFFTLRAATRQMVTQGEGGSLILTSSGTAIQGAAKGQAYASTKGAMIAMIMGLSTEMVAIKMGYVQRSSRESRDRRSSTA